jgi:hypothetical protein
MKRYSDDSGCIENGWRVSSFLAMVLGQRNRPKQLDDWHLPIAIYENANLSDGSNRSQKTVGLLRLNV